jgi:cyclic beta-1,2-glucan synthetase
MARIIETYECIPTVLVAGSSPTKTNSSGGADTTVPEGMKPVSIRRVTKEFFILRKLIQLPLGRQFLVHAHPMTIGADATMQWRTRAVFNALDVTQSLLAELRLRQGTRRAELALSRPHRIAEALLGSRPPINSVPNRFAESLSGCQPQLSSDELCAAILALRIAILRDIGSSAVNWVLQRPAMKWTPIAYLLLALDSAMELLPLQVASRVVAVTAILSLDPKGTFDKMAASTQEQYLLSVRDAAIRLNKTDLEVAMQALESARTHIGDARLEHVGAHLPLGGGHDHNLESSTRYLSRICFWSVLLSFGSAFALPSTISTSLAIALALGLLVANAAGVTEIYSIFALIRCPRERRLRMDASRCHARVAVVVPTRLVNQRQLDTLIATIEQNLESFRDESDVYVLLTDFADAARLQPNAEEAQLLDRLRHMVLQWNATRFHCVLLHRDRSFYRKEKLWLGRERKRGKLEDFNAFVVGDADCFTAKVGALQQLKKCDFAFVLDEDGLLLRQAMDPLLGAALHPLNWPVIDSTKRCVVEGYGLWTSQSLVLAESVRVVSGSAGKTPPSRDWFFELFGQSRYSGKGLYRIETFHTLLGNRFPANQLLSHDTVEGAALRAGYMEDPVFAERTIGNYYVRCARAHRWTRGDWQNTVFCCFRSNAIGKVLRASPIGAVSILLQTLRWLVPIAQFVVLLAVVTLGEGAALRLLAVLLVPGLLPGIVGLLATLGTDYNVAPILTLTARSVRGLTLRMLIMVLRIVIAPHSAIIHVDAIGRSTHAMLSRRGLLNWAPFTNTDVQTFSRTYHILSSVGFAILLCFLSIQNALGIIPSLILSVWIFSPMIVKTNLFNRMLYGSVGQ